MRLSTLKLFFFKPSEPEFNVSPEEDRWWWSEMGRRTLKRTFGQAALSIGLGAGIAVGVMTVIRYANGASPLIPKSLSFMLWFIFAMWGAFGWNALYKSARTAAIRSRRLRAAMTLEDGDD